MLIGSGSGGGGVAMIGSGGGTGSDASAGGGTVSLPDDRSIRRRSSANSASALLARFDACIATTNATTANTATKSITQPCMECPRIHAEKKRPAEAGPSKRIASCLRFARLRREQHFASDEIQQHDQHDERNARQKVGVFARDERIRGRELIELVVEPSHDRHAGHERDQDARDRAA